MSYQVLARKWRPKNFGELVGQEHVVSILANALSQNRLHHAYLFTGTRGVGKTTIARIFAKSLNCVEGVTAQPCGICDACQDITQGNFVDLLEIDAASRTKVDDTREILENVQYAPSRGRYKVYIIDEVHMLSRSSFNALLKTLEEPPEHVKFILATTDPQKLPITVLSRCLQFHLKALTAVQIETKLSEILAAEQVSHEPGSLKLIAKAARGSMRDSLSLTDQAIAQGQGKLLLANLQHMLGSIDQNWPYRMLIALLKQDAQELMNLSQEIASYSPSYSRLFAELIQLLHQIAMSQVVSYDFSLTPEQSELMQKFAQAMSPEDVQLYYQICVNGRKDLPYAADEQAAFDMTLLRLLAFKPVANSAELPAVDNKKAEIDFEQSALTSTNIEAPAIELPKVEVEPEKMAQPVTEQILAQEVAAIEQEAHILQGADTPQFSSPSSNSVMNQEHQLDNVIADNAEQAQQAVSANEYENNLSATPLNEEIKPESEDIASHTQEVFSPNVEVVPQNAEAGPQSAPISNNEMQQQAPVTDLNAPAQTDVQAPVDPQSPAEVELSSPIQSVIQQRNMLRSRKKKQENTAKKSESAKAQQPSVAELQKQAAKDVPEPEQLPQTPFTPEIIDPARVRKANQVDKWANMIDAMALNGRLRQMAINATIDPSSNDERLVLCLNQKTKHLKTEAAHQQLIEFVSHYFNKPMSVEVNIVEQTQDDPYQIQSHINDKRYEYAKEVLLNDEIVLQMQQNFQAELDESTVIAR